MYTPKTVFHKYSLLKDFLNESSIHGLRLLLFYTPYKYARILWKLLLFSIIVSTHFIIVILIMQYLEAPTEVRMSTNLVHVSNTPFPGVAICSANKFSRAKIQAFAEKVFAKQQLYKPYYLAQSTQEMAQHLLVLRGFYVFPYDNEPLNATTINRLDKIFTFMFNTTDYPARDYLKYLAPDCKDLVVRGMLFGTAVNTTEYFNKRLTSSSVCCMFNYKRKSYAIDKKVRDADNAFVLNSNIIQIQSNSILNSVQFVLQTETDDYTITEFSNEAFQIFVFPQEDYATIQSNRVGEILVNHNTIVEIPIQPDFIGSTHRVRQFSPSIRKCYFPDEGQKLLNKSYYSIDECLLLCRMDSMIQYCGCITPPMSANEANQTYCAVIDLPCLRNWNSIWYGWDTFEYVHENGKDIDDDNTAGHRCPHCLPTCNGVNFNIEVNVRPMRQTYGKFYSHGILNGLSRTKPLAIIKLYFKQRYAESTEMDIVGDWVVLLNRFGGIMSLMYGFSVISYIEILYFATWKYFTFYLLKWKNKVNQKIYSASISANAIEKIDPPPAYNLYWKELKPKQPVNMEIFKHKVILNLYKRDE